MPGGGQAPRQLTSFVGRRADLVALDELLEAGRPLVTVLGPPGIGKTRLVQRWLASTRPDALAVFCDLRGVDGAAGLGAAVAEALDARLEDGDDADSLVDTVGDLLPARDELLLVLDNCEQLASDAARTVHRWLRAAPKARFLVTSRRRLRLEGEVAYELSPLSVRALENERASEAARLFLDRAREAEPRFAVDEVAAGDVEALVARLEGLPLAIELAASQMRHHRPRDLLHVLERRPAIALESCWTDADARHVSLRAAIDASWRCLEPVERDALSQLTVFRQGFDLDAAEHVLDLSNDDLAPPVVEVIGSLRDASLLRVEDVGAKAPMRWSLYESVREYAREHRDAGVIARHARCFLERGQRWATELATPHRVEARAAIARDLANIRRAFDWFARQEETAARECAQLALALYEVHRITRPALAIDPLTVALDRVEASADPALHGWLHLARGGCYRSLGQSVKAEADFDAVAVASQSNPELTAELEFERGVHLFHIGRLAEPKRRFEAAVSAARSLGRTQLEARAEMRLGWVLADGYQDESAFDHYERAVALFREIGDARGEWLTRSLATVHAVFQRRGNYEAELEAQVATARDLQDSELEAMAEQHLGIHLADNGDLVAARCRFERARDIAASCGHKRAMAVFDLNIGAVLEQAGERKVAKEVYLHALETFRATGEERFESLVLSRLALHWASESRTAKAGAALDKSYSIARQTGDAALELVSGFQRSRVTLLDVEGALVRGDIAEAARLRTEAVERVDGLKERAVLGGSQGRNGRTVLSCSPEARWALDLFQRDLESTSGSLLLLRVWSDGSAFQLGDQNVVALPKGPTIRAVLRALGEERALAPGRSISVEGFMQRCWGDETVSPLVGSQRVRNIIARLRKAGLAEVLRRDEAGYLLIPKVRFLWVDSTVDGDDRASAPAP